MTNINESDEEEINLGGFAQYAVTYEELAAYDRKMAIDHPKRTKYWAKEAERHEAMAAAHKANQHN